MRQSAYDNNFWDEDYDEEVESDGGGSPSTNLVSVPASVRQHLSRSDQPVQQIQPKPLYTGTEMALMDLARSSPDLAASLIGAALGVRKITHTQTDKNEYYERVPRKVLGFNCGEEFVKLSTSRTTIKKWEVG